MAAITSSLSRSLAAKLRGGGGGSGGALASLSPYSRWTPASPPPPSFSTSAAAVADSSSSASAAAVASPSKENPKRWSRWLLFIPGAITFGLGTWQIFRRQDKIKMLEYRQMRLDLDPLKLNDATPSEKPDSLEFRRVACTGVFDERKSIFVGPRSRSISGVTENGYYLISPLVPIANNSGRWKFSCNFCCLCSVKSAVLANRGWVPRSWREEFSKSIEDREQPATVDEIVESKRHWWSFWSKTPESIKESDKASDVIPEEIVGVVRGSEKPSIFVPENDPSSSQWFYVDVPTIARTCGLPENTLYIEVVNDNVNPSNPYPIPKDVNTLIRSSVMPQDHLNYTLTWYSLSAAVTFMAFKRLRQKNSRR